MILVRVIVAVIVLYGITELIWRKMEEGIEWKDVVFIGMAMMGEVYLLKG